MKTKLFLLILPLSMVSCETLKDPTITAQALDIALRVQHLANDIQAAREAGEDLPDFPSSGSK